MSNRTDEDIRSLIDSAFEDFEESEDNFVHFMHPSQIGMQWCGKPEPKNTGSGAVVIEKPVTCPECLELLSLFGSDYWWRTAIESGIRTIRQKMERGNHL